MGGTAMMKLAGTFTTPNNIEALARRTVRRLSNDPTEVTARPDQLALVLKPGSRAPDGCLSISIDGDGCEPSGSSPFLTLPAECAYVVAGDILRLEPSGRFRVLYRRNSAHNNFLVTERCDNFCLMCSQPPKKIDDDWVLDDLFQVVRLLEEDTGGIGFTGGEPTLAARFIDLLKLCHDRLPDAAIHVLSNGRRFADLAYAQEWASVQHRDLMVGIPIYSDLSTIHDYVVQADGAYDETIRGILNLKRLKQRVEIRVVLHKQTYLRLPQLARFIARNLLFVDHVALMGLEITGFTRANLDALWIDPVEYQRELYEAVTILDDFGIRTSIYNLQLCLLDRRLWKHAVKSISDWKREYFPECADCAAQTICGGMFSSATYRHSEHLKSIRDEAGLSLVEQMVVQDHVALLN
jgi:His-Xaa-Ser system radical SAM maturase HxsC